MLRVSKSSVLRAVVSTAVLASLVGPAPRLIAGDTTAATGRALNRPLPEVKFNNAPLSEVLDFLSDSTSANFAVDWKALDAAHVAKDAPITLRMSSALPLHKVLILVLDQAAGAGVLTYYTDEGVIEITSQEASDKVLISRTYPIQDLLFSPTDYNDAPSLSLQNAGQGQSGGGGGGGGGGGSGSGQLFDNTSGSSSSSNSTNSQKDKADEIIKLITDTVKPELWQVNGGTATINFFRGMLIVNAPRSIHELLESN